MKHKMSMKKMKRRDNEELMEYMSSLVTFVFIVFMLLSLLLLFFLPPLLDPSDAFHQVDSGHGPFNSLLDRRLRSIN